MISLKNKNWWEILTAKEILQVAQMQVREIISSTSAKKLIYEIARRKTNA